MQKKICIDCIYIYITDHSLAKYKASSALTLYRPINLVQDDFGCNLNAVDGEKDCKRGLARALI
jgi:hypothetical protein